MIAMRPLAGMLFAVLSVSPAGARPLVAVIDSGVAQTGELGSVLVAEYDMAGDRPAFAPRYDHGTMVATILAREAHGQIGIISLRIDDPAGCPVQVMPPCQGSPARIVAAIRRATDLKVDVINISMALADDGRIADAVHDAAAQGITVVLAAGNNGFDHPGNLRIARAGYPRTVLVGALDAGGRPWQGSNRPGAIRWFDYDYVWQRGVDVPTENREGQPVLGTGTSFAAPIEAARLAVGLQRSIAGMQTRQPSAVALAGPFEPRLAADGFDTLTAAMIPDAPQAGGSLKAF
jgi:subtilisin family serine protease